MCYNSSINRNKEQIMRNPFYIVAIRCEYTGNPTAATMQVFTEREDAYEAVRAMERADPEQGAQIWAERPVGGFKAVAMVEDDAVVYF
jgi:hypothetical protein